MPSLSDMGPILFNLRYFQVWNMQYGINSPIWHT